MASLDVGRRPPRARALLAFGVLLFVAAVVVRLPGLGRSLFYDELFTARNFADSLAHAVLAQKQANNHPLASLLAWASSALLGRTDALALRAPSVLVGALAVVATAWLAERSGSKVVVFLAGLLALVHPAHVGFSQEVRGYALVLLFTPLVLRLALDVSAGEKRLAGLLVVSVALGLWAHLTFALVVLGVGGYLLFCKGIEPSDRRRALAALALGSGLGVVLLAPVLGHVGKFAEHHVGMGDAAGGWPTLERLGAVGEMLAVADARLAPVLPIGGALAVLALVGLVARGGERRVPAAIACVMVATATVWLLARPLFYARFFAFLIPLAIVLAARGAGEVARRIAGEKRRAMALLVASPLVLGGAWATGERAGWETQPTGPALAFARGPDVGEIGYVGLGDDLFWTVSISDATRERPLVAVIELFPERSPALPDEYRGFEEIETQVFPGLYSPVRVHIFRPRRH